MGPWLWLERSPPNHARTDNAMRLMTIGHDAAITCQLLRLRLAFAPTTITKVPGGFHMRHWLAGLMLLVAPSAFAQQAVPNIAFDSVPNPLKLPPNMYFG